MSVPPNSAFRLSGEDILRASDAGRRAVDEAQAMRSRVLAEAGRDLRVGFRSPIAERPEDV